MSDLDGHVPVGALRCCSEAKQPLDQGPVDAAWGTRTLKIAMLNSVELLDSVASRSLAFLVNEEASKPGTVLIVMTVFGSVMLMNED